jgi:hypothetical protein
MGKTFQISQALFIFCIDKDGSGNVCGAGWLNGHPLKTLERGMDGSDGIHADTHYLILLFKSDLLLCIQLGQGFQVISPH